MAKRKPSKQPLQARHKEKSTPSQHDRRHRLLNKSKQRVETQAARVPLVGSIAMIAASISMLLDARTAFRLPIIMAGVFLARGRRTASSWLRAAGVRDDWDRFYDAIASIGRRADSLAVALIRAIVLQLGIDLKGLIVVALDDSPTKRYGRHVEGANIHHNPTPGPGDGDWLYGHNWVCLAWLVRHPVWGIIALPILSQLYVRQIDVETLKGKYPLEFCTKIELAIGLLQRFVRHVRWLNQAAKFLTVVDCAYATKKFIQAATELNVTVVSRLRKNASLFDLPVPRQPGQRGRPRKYGANKLNLNSIASEPTGWEPITYNRRGVVVTAKFKTFLATTSISTKPIRVVLVMEEGKHWAAMFSTDSAMDPKSILESYSSRWSIEECFHDLKEVWQAGKQQVRNLWSSIGCWHLNCWSYILTELDSWDMSSDELVDRRDRPWDNPDRRPSHADRRRWIAGKMLRERFSKERHSELNETKVQALLDELLTLAA
jgi:hypothetical protein